LANHMEKLTAEGQSLQVVNVFDTMRKMRPDLQPSAKMYTHLLQACAANSGPPPLPGHTPLPDRGLEFYQEMLQFNLQLDLSSYGDLVILLSGKDYYDQSKAWVGEMRQRSLPITGPVYSALFGVYSRSNDFNSCMQLFEECQQKGVRLAEDDFYNLLAMALKVQNSQVFEQLMQAMVGSVKRTKKGIWGLLRRYYSSLATNFDTAEAQLDNTQDKKCTICSRPFAPKRVLPEARSKMLEEVLQTATTGGIKMDILSKLESWLMDRKEKLKPTLDSRFCDKFNSDPKECPDANKCWFAHEAIVQEKRFDAVLDGENIAKGASGTELFSRIDAVLKSLTADGKQVLVVLSVQQLQTNSSAGGKEILARWASEDIIAYCPVGCDNTLFWFYACLLNGGTDMWAVSNNEFSGQEAAFMQSPEFSQWRNLHQATFLVEQSGEGEKSVKIEGPKKSFEYCIQKDEDGSWHFPDSESDSWLCVKKKLVTTA